MNLTARVQSYTNGLSVLKDWLGDGGECVPQDLAQTRTDICNKCPMNQPGNMLVEGTARAIKEQMKLKNKLGMRTDGIKSLQSCSACSCWLPLKIWVPIDRIRPTEDERSSFDPNCWLLHE